MFAFEWCPQHVSVIRSGAFIGIHLSEVGCNHIKPIPVKKNNYMKDNVKKNQISKFVLRAVAWLFIDVVVTGVSTLIADVYFNNPFPNALLIGLVSSTGFVSFGLLSQLLFNRAPASHTTEKRLSRPTGAVTNER